MSSIGSFSHSSPVSTGAVPLGIGSQPPEPAGSVDPALVQQTKNEIRQIVTEITQLSQTDLSQEQFIEGFLPRVVSALAAAGGAIWTRGEDGGIELQYQINYPTSQLSDDVIARKRHALLLHNLVQSGHATLVPPQSGAASADEAGNPTDFLLILATLKVEQQVVGVVEVFQRASGGPTTQRGYLRFLVQMAELASDFLKNRRLRHLGDRQTLWQSLERFLRLVHSSLDLQTTVFHIVNESRPLIGCDRVSLALPHGRNYSVRAVSGLDSIDRRAAEARLLGELATAVAATGQPFWYRGDAHDLAPQLERPLQDYLDQSHAKWIGMVPLRRSDESPSPAPADGTPLGLLIVENLGKAVDVDGFVDRIDAIAVHSSSALANALEHHHVFLLPLWQALGKSKWVLQARTLPKTLGIAAGVISLLMMLVVVPADFRLAARGKLQPSIRQEVFAQIDGTVVAVPVKHEQMVTANQLLCTLNNNDLEVEISNLFGRKHTTQERINNVQRSLLNDRRLSVEERNRLDGELLELRQVEESIERELSLLQAKREQLVVRSPMRGQVVTWNVQDVLLRRPVQRGDLLMSVVDPQGPWELELYLPERRLGHVLQASRDLPEELQVTFLLASHLDQKLQGRVVELHRTAEIHGDEGNSVILRVAIDKDDLPELHSDTTVVAQVHCGSRSIGYVWFHEVLETIQSKILFWL